MKKLISNEKNQKLLFMVYGILILVIYNCNILRLGSICIIGDEFGYWATGATFAGMDWSEVASYNSYYSFGYGLWLAVILKVCGNSILAYRAAIILNSVFVVGIYILLTILLTRFFHVEKRTKAYTISFVTALFSGLYFAAQSTQCETILAFFYILEILLLVWYLKYGKIKQLILLSVNTLYLYCIHQRSIVILIALAVILILQLILDHSRIKNFCIFVILAACLFFVTILIKDQILSRLYLDGVAVTANNFFGQTGKLQMLLSVSGIKLFLKGVLGKLYYMGTASFGMCYFGILFFIREFVKEIKKIRMREKTGWTFLFSGSARN